MRDPEAAVTDTHPLLFHAAGGGRLGHRAAAIFERCEQREAIIYVSVAVIWETSLMARVGRVNLRRSVQVFFDDLFSNPAISLSISHPIMSTPLTSSASRAIRSTRSSSRRHRRWGCRS